MESVLADAPWGFERIYYWGDGQLVVRLYGHGSPDGRRALRRAPGLLDVVMCNETRPAEATDATFDPEPMLRTKPQYRR